VVPDGPLLFALAGAALTLAALFFDAPAPRAAWAWWLAAGVWLGLAALSKYSAALAAFGVLVFVVASPRQRHWLAHPAPYAAALIALAMVSPAFIWNARHGWVSMAFQGERAAIGGAWRPAQLGAMLLGEIAYLSPWIFVPLAGALVAAARKASQDEKRLFLLCLAAPPILVFTLTPLWGARGLPHWPMPGWFFAYPLLGAWLGEPWAAHIRLRRWAIVSAGLIGAIAVFAVSQATTGWLTRLLPLRPGAGDPTLETLDWGALRTAPALEDDAAFVVATKWMEAGKIALALGPQTPVFVFSGDPRGMAFLDDSGRFIGRDAVIVVPEARVDQTLEHLRAYFERFDPPQSFALRRAGRDEIALALIGAHGLTRAFPVPYPH
jgi:4-amino-4-deoxy-L-arabinose transferase-like glycosyltransferase